MRKLSSHHRHSGRTVFLPLQPQKTPNQNIHHTATTEKQQIAQYMQQRRYLLYCRPELSGKLDAAHPVPGQAAIAQPIEQSLKPTQTINHHETIPGVPGAFSGSLEYPAKGRISKVRQPDKPIPNLSKLLYLHQQRNKIIFLLAFII